MKKTLLMTFALVAAAALADGTYLYWMVDQTGAEPGTETYQFDYATLRESGSSTYLCLKNGTDALDSNADRLTTDGHYWSVDGDYTGSYLFELWVEDLGGNGIRAAFATVSASYLDANGFIYRNQETSGDLPYVVTASQLVPEPTGGLLVALGAALLALRRRDVRG